MIKEIIEKLDELRSLDKYCLLFGADRHQYHLGEKLTEENIVCIEDHFKISLPLHYREFLLNVGNGGAGPGFGINAIGNLEVGSASGCSCYSSSMTKDDWMKHLELHAKGFSEKYHRYASSCWEEPCNFSKEFKLVDNIVHEDENIPEEDEEYTKWEKKAEEEYLLVGNYRIAGYGCNQTASLILTGPSKGLVWYTDWETNSMYNSEHDFIQWYLNWLNYSLNDVEERYVRFEREGSFWP